MKSSCVVRLESSVVKGGKNDKNGVKINVWECSKNEVFFLSVFLSSSSSSSSLFVPPKSASR